MLCRKPFVVAGKAFGCGQCLPCRINRRKVWAHRIVLESRLHSESAFVTLTYSDDTIPRIWTEGFGSQKGMKVLCGTLVPRHLQLFLKKIRKSALPRKLRFFAVGEYGEKTERPHYHVILFGHKPCARGGTLRHYGNKEPLWFDCCEACRQVGLGWGRGNVLLGSVSADSASYVAEYTVKKMTSVDDSRLRGRNPEFARMSLRRGLGYAAIPDIAEALDPYNNILVDVPYLLRHGMKEWPLGSYLRRSLRVMLDRDEKAPQETLDVMEEKLRAVRQAAFDGSESFSSKIVEVNEQGYRDLVARSEVFKSRRKM